MRKVRYIAVAKIKLSELQVGQYYESTMFRNAIDSLNEGTPTENILSSLCAKIECYRDIVHENHQSEDEIAKAYHNVIGGLKDWQRHPLRGYAELKRWLIGFTDKAADEYNRIGRARANIWK